MPKRIIALCLCAAMALPLGGCWDSRELSQQIFALSLGLDAGETLPLRLTVLMPGIDQSGSGKQGSSHAEGNGPSIIDQSLYLNGYVLAQAEGNDLLECLDVLNATTTRALSLSQLRDFYISESIAKSDLLFSSLASIIHSRQVRPMALIYVCLGRAEDVLRMENPTFGSRLSKTITAEIESLQEASVISILPISEFYGRLLSAGGDAYGILTAVNTMGYIQETAPRGAQSASRYAGELPVNITNPIQMYGTALFHSSRMVGMLDGYETQLLNMCLGDFKRGDILVQDAAGNMKLGLQQLRPPKIKVQMQGERPVISVDVKLAASTYADPLVQDFLLVQQRATSLIQNDLTNLLLKLQALQTDPINFTGHARKNVLTLQEWDQFGWQEKYMQAGFSVSVDLALLKSSTTINR